MLTGAAFFVVSTHSPPNWRSYCASSQSEPSIEARGRTTTYTTRVDATSWISTPVELTASFLSIAAVSRL